MFTLFIEKTYISNFVLIIIPSDVYIFVKLKQEGGNN